jgi:type II restriction/modification system DNA methylase subunit YeeA
LKLLNENGIFSFITSNSWLDVDFGSTLQEFLIYFVENAKIIDNSSQRSFKSADINTIITFFSAPNLH